MGTILFFAKRLIWARRSIFYLLLLLITVAVTILFKINELSDEASDLDLVERFRDDLGPFLLGAIGVLIPLLYATSAFAQEHEAGTSLLLVTRPRARARILFEKFVATALVCVPMMVLAIALPAAIMLPLGHPGSWHILGNYCGIGALASLAYASTFHFIGLALPRPMLWGAALAVGWEGFLGTLPGNLQAFTVQNQVARYLAASCGQTQWTFGSPIETEAATTTQPVVGLLVVTALFYALAHLHFRTRQVK